MSGGRRGAYGSRPRPVRTQERLFVRWVPELPEGRPARAVAQLREQWLRELERVGRLVAAGPTVEPPGHLAIVRAVDRKEAERALRLDPFRSEGTGAVQLFDWRPDRAAAGVNLEPPPGRGAGRLTELHRISVFVRDPAEAGRWYREVLGLTVRAEDPETELLELSLGPGAAGLTLLGPRPSWGEALYRETIARVGRATGISFRTDSVEALALRLRHAGARVTQAPRPEPWGGRSLRFTDPDGNEFLAFDDGPRRAEPVPPPPRRRHRRRSEAAAPAGP